MKKNNTKGGIWKLLLKIAGALAAAAATVTAVMVALLRRSAKRMAEHNDEKNVGYSVGMGRDTCSLESDIDNAFLNSVAGSLTVEWKEEPQHDVMLDLSGICSRITVCVPGNARVCCMVDAPEHRIRIEEGIDLADGDVIADDATADDAAESAGADAGTEDAAPIITITGKLRLSGLRVRR